ncbi:hypothetical protein MKX03_026873 [Papaver bracteatum]|nr:hypothetical protein MKX03_026873 [Papaver bracteatum]
MDSRIQILFCLFSLVFVLNAFHQLSAAATDTSYFLSCGAANTGTDSDGRKWEPDTKYLVSSDNSILATAQFQDPSLPSPVPYMTSRIFNKESTYTFPVASGKRHWLRLHFYPSNYNSLNPSDSYFEVVAGGVTLLSNFSASITALALTQSYIIKEFSLISSDDKVLNITFKPSPDYKGSYAFVNGIEIVEMPDLFKPANLVGMSDQTVETATSTLQTLFRLNVGGQYIPAVNDSGLTRTWYDDTPYLYGAAVGVTGKADGTKIEFAKDYPQYTAPYDVYATFRSMGPDSQLNKNFNLTWVFQVDGNYMYVVRLHFCELINSKPNQRVFDIYVNNQTAEAAADVIAWSGGQGVPFYKDYAIFVNDGPGDEEIWVALHPTVSEKPETYDSLLNGMEIFKVNSTNGSLAGPNPKPSDMLLKAQPEEAKEFESDKKGKGAIIGVSCSAAALGFLAAICIAFHHNKKKSEGSDSGLTSGWLPLYTHSTTSSKTSNSNRSCTSSHLSSLAAGLCRHFSLPEIKQGTKNFDESQIIGVGGFGKVYKGVIDGGTKVAIKRANPSSEQGVHEFRTEIEMLSKLRHRHLVSLIGFCEEDDEMILVYDYMAHGTLREHLYKHNKTHLEWKQRLEICIGAARGLHYLHTGAKYTIIHRDVKTTNILVDENWVAKVSDFGLSKTGPNMNQTHVSTVVKGSFGYLDPEYFRRQQLTEKSDVYSFGVVLFEVLTARQALNPSLPKEQVSLADWALHCQKKGVLEDIIDPHLKGKINPECLKKFAETAEKCLSDHGVDRPSMGDVLWNLEFALQLQENLVGDGAANKTSERPAPPAPAISLHDLELENETTDADGINTSAVFSQLINPQGR